MSIATADLPAPPPPSGRATASSRLCRARIPSFRADGGLLDLAAPSPEMIDFAEMSARLARIARFTGAGQDGGRGFSVSVAQHCVMGAQALMNEGESRFTAALFLLHDAHEYAIGDLATPVVRLIEETMDDREPGTAFLFRVALTRIKAAWDEAIYGAAHLPPPAAWTARDTRVIGAMDQRMMAAEAEALFGPGARRTLSPAEYPQPRTTGAIEAWPAMKAEEQFDALLARLAPPARRCPQPPAGRRIAPHRVPRPALA